MVTQLALISISTSSSMNLIRRKNKIKSDIWYYLPSSVRWTVRNSNGCLHWGQVTFWLYVAQWRMHVTLHKRKAKPLKTNTDSTKVQTLVSIRSKYTFINPETF